MIRESIEVALSEIEDWESQKLAIVRQIETLVQRGKSRRIMGLVMSGKYPYFRQEIEAYLEDMSDTDALEKEVQKYRNRYTGTDQKSREKIIAALMRKGFEYREIRNILMDRGE